MIWFQVWCLWLYKEGKDRVAADEIVVVWDSGKASWAKSGNLDLEAASQGIRRDLMPFQDRGEVGIRLEEMENKRERSSRTLFNTGF